MTCRIKKVFVLAAAAALTMCMNIGADRAVFSENAYAQTESVPIESLYFDCGYANGVTLSIGETMTFETYVYPPETTSYLIWSTSDASVATVDSDGVLTVNGYGDVTVTAKSSDGGCEYSLDIYICGPKYYNADKLKLSVGESFKLDIVKTYARSTDYQGNWSSRDESVVTVDSDGTVHAVGTGSTSVYCWDISDECYVTVTDGGEPGLAVVRPDWGEDAAYTVLAGREYPLPLTNANDDYDHSSCDYGSYDSTVAEYDADTRTIKAVGAGECTINTQYGYLNVRVISPYVKYTVKDGVITECIGGNGAVIIPDEIDGETICGIGQRAFWRSGLKSVVIPGTVTHIDYDAFYGCDELEKIVFNDGLETIGRAAFASCGSLKEVILPQTVTGIDDGAFSGCGNIERIYLPPSLKEIGDSALADISPDELYYGGSRKDWLSLTIGESNDCFSDIDSNYGSIYTAEQLYEIASCANSGSSMRGKKLVLMNDISLGGAEWTPIGISYTDKVFNGSFDGNGHTVSDFKITKPHACNGFFGMVDSYGEIKNLSIKNVTIDIRPQDSLNTTMFTGIFVGWSDGVITGCSACGSITLEESSKSGRRIGGFAGRIAGSTSECSSEAKMRIINDAVQTYEVGGFCGEVYRWSGSGSLSDCTAVSDIYYKGVSRLGIGGIAGYQAPDAVSTVRCTAKGKINAVFDNDEKNVWLGGIIGYNSKTVQDNISYMDIVYSSKNDIYSGTFFGYSEYGKTVSGNEWHGSLNRAPYASFDLQSSGAEGYKYQYTAAAPQNTGDFAVTALYAENKLLGVIAGGESSTITLSEKPDKYKVFVWSKADKITPLQTELNVDMH